MKQYEPYTCLISLYYKENPAYLEECLSSVIAQTVPPEEILIVKDGPLSESLEQVLERFDYSNPGLFSFVSYSENIGLWYALRKGVPECRNEIIMRMDVDDWSSPNRAEKQLQILRENLDIGCVGSLVTEFIDDIDNPIALVALPEKHEDIVSFGKRRCPYRHPSLMYRKDAILLAGNYQEMPYFEDYDLYMRLASSGCRFYNIQESLVFMRTSPDFYARRGSVSYLRDMLRFKTACLRRGDYSFFDYLICTIPHVIVSLMPNRLREFVYNRFLRSRVEHTGGDK